MIFRRVCKEDGCAFCGGDVTSWHNYYGRDDRTYVVCDRCSKIINDVLDEKEVNMEYCFDHLEPLELIEKLPFTHQMMFAYGTAYAMDDAKGEGVIPMTSDGATMCDASLVFAHQHFPPYAMHRAEALKRYKILEDHRLGQDKEHLMKKLKEAQKECEKIEKRIAELEEKE